LPESRKKDALTTLPLDTRNIFELAICAFIRSPPNPLAALIPNPVPLVLQFVEVVPVGSTSNCGFVVVAVPPVNQVPVSVVAGAEAAPLADTPTAPVNVSPVNRAWLYQVDPV